MTQLSDKDLFKAGFLMRMAERGVAPQDLDAGQEKIAASAVQKEAAVGGGLGLAGLLLLLTSGGNLVKNIGTDIVKPVAQIGALGAAAPLVGVPLAAGIGGATMGYLGGRMSQKPVNTSEMSLKAQADAYNQQGQELSVSKDRARRLKERMATRASRGIL